jgi:hypothetical protein
MAYALFCNEARLSKAYPTEADVWRVARQSGLVVDVRPDQVRGTQPMLDNDYEIRRCEPEPQEDPVQNRIEADREPLFSS